MATDPVDERVTLASLFYPLFRTDTALVVPDPCNILTRWNLRHDDHEAERIAEQLETAWEKWATYERPQWKHLLLGVAEAIADAETAKVHWNPKATGTQYRQLAERALNAGKTAKQIYDQYPHPWDSSHRAEEEIVTTLIDYMVSGLVVSSQSDYMIADGLAREALSRLRLEIPRAVQISNALIGKLAWLASGEQWDSLTNEITIRRYSAERDPHLTPAAPFWKDNWHLVGEIVRLAPAAARWRTFAHNMRASLVR